MKSIFRATTPADADSISELLATVFGAASDLSRISREAMFWKYWSPHPFWEGSRSYVLECQGRVVAHGAVVPQWCRWGTRRFRSFHLIDWAALGDAPGSGVSLFRRALQLADAGWVVGGSDMTQRVLPTLGFREVGKATRYVRPLHPLRRLAGLENKTWRSLAQFSRSVLWAVQAPSLAYDGVAIPWSPDSTREAWPLPNAGACSAIFERTPELFAFFQSCPMIQTRLFGLELNSAARGYFLLATLPGQVRIADCWLESNRVSHWRDLYLAAVAQAYSSNEAAEVVTVVSDDLQRNALQQAGFHARGDYPIRFFSKDLALSQVPALRCELFDSDAVYLDSGRLWA
jgi:hypothetical protein